ncbi:hypothetical protein E2C01_051958 [Portunus trituberculatus]|uniref:Uncharacterized protein n=1 Tax=Portunus trituberculatus TaxID=210409 RepID=A0A5B7GK95_PORTR|nr:hypothetical protein [Portunus trituberculatus]
MEEKSPYQKSSLKNEADESNASRPRYKQDNKTSPPHHAGVLGNGEIHYEMCLDDAMKELPILEENPDKWCIPPPPSISIPLHYSLTVTTCFVFTSPRHVPIFTSATW